MKSISDLTKDYKAGQEKSRKELLKMFITRLNKDLRFAKMEEKKDVFYCVKLAPVKTHELESLYREWDRTGNFSKCFWSRIK